MGNDQSIKPKINRPRRRIYEEPTTAAQSAEKSSSVISSIETPIEVSERSKENLVESDSRTEETLPVVLTEKGTTAEALTVPESLVPKAEKLLRGYIVGAMGFGLIPIPVIGIASLIPIQLSLVAELADLYDVPFKRDRDKSALAGALGGLLAQILSRSKFSLMTRAIPVLGPVIGFITFPILAGASTYAVGHVFIRHFESGGTLLDFKVNKVKAYFKSKFRQGKTVAAAMRRG